MLILKDFDKTLVTYLYEPDKLVAKVQHKLNSEGTGLEPVAVLETVKGKKKGVIVAIGDGILGWSMCNTKPGWSRKEGWHEGDKFDKVKGLDLALKRAQIAKKLDPVDRESFYEKVPETLIDMFEEMELRAQKYFAVKVKPSEDDLPF